jgi:hypothetical protein
MPLPNPMRLPLGREQFAPEPIAEGLEAERLRRPREHQGLLALLNQRKNHNLLGLEIII